MDDADQDVELEFDQPLEEDTENTEVDSNSKIYTDQKDPEIDSLIGRYQRGKLIVQPDFQRHFVWDEGKSSRLIESALLDIPLPVVYIAEENDGKEYVIDGQQRLTSFFSFVNGAFPDGKAFRLSGLKVFQNYNGKLYSELSEAEQDKIRYYKIHTIVFRKESDPNLKFEIFERLNTGSISLNDQELRNCIYRGPYNDLIRSLATEEDFRYLLNLDKPEKRMKDVELVLRFAAFYHATYLKYRSPMRLFLNRDMMQYQHITKEQAAELKNAFKNSISIIRSMFDKNAFRRFYAGTDNTRDGYWEPKKFNVSLYDILMVLFADKDKNTVFKNMDSIREAFIDLMTNDDEFVEAIELGTSEPRRVVTRFDKWRIRMQDVIGNAKNQPRCFTSQLKQELFNENSSCAICGQQIRGIDDSAVDHIEQYWTGGQTIPENARLTHRYCNMARSKHDVAVAQSGR